MNSRYSGTKSSVRNKEMSTRRGSTLITVTCKTIISYQDDQCLRYGTVYVSWLQGCFILRFVLLG